MGVATPPGCASGDEQGCDTWSSEPPTRAETPNWFEEPVVGGFRVWQIMFLCLAAVMTIVIFLCCCIRFRIPRTKQEIEADYVRKKITRKFQKQLRCIQNADMDDMDLKRALDRVRAEFKSDTESIAPSEATLSSGGCNCNQDMPVAPQLLLAPPLNGDNTYTKGSDLLIAADEGEQEAQSGFGKKFASLVENTLVKFRTKRQQAE